MMVFHTFQNISECYDWQKLKTIIQELAENQKWFEAPCHTLNFLLTIYSLLTHIQWW